MNPTQPRVSICQLKIDGWTLSEPHHCAVMTRELEDVPELNKTRVPETATGNEQQKPLHDAALSELRRVTIPVKGKTGPVKKEIEHVKYVCRVAEGVVSGGALLGSHKTLKKAPQSRKARPPPPVF